MSAITNSTESFLSNIATAKWDTQRITSEGNIVGRSNWLGRKCSCFGNHGKKYDVASAILATKEQITAYMKPESEIGELELATRSGIVAKAIEKLNTLVDRVNAKRAPEKQIEKISFDAAPAAKKEEAVTVDPNKVEDIDSFSSTPLDATPPTAKKEEVSSSVDPVKKGRKRKKEERTVDEGKQFVQNFKSKLSTPSKG